MYPLAGDNEYSQATSETDPKGCASPTTGAPRAETTQVFKRGGRIEFLFQGASLCVSPGVSAVLYGFVDIGAGRSTAQGPTLPQLYADDGRMGA